MAYMPTMRLKDWRLAAGLSIAELARELGIAGVNPGGTLARIETGARQADATMTDRIIRRTAGAVAADDMHQVRLEWLRANRPDKFPQDAESVRLAGASDGSMPDDAPAFSQFANQEAAE